MAKYVQYLVRFIKKPRLKVELESIADNKGITLNDLINTVLDNFVGGMKLENGLNKLHNLGKRYYLLMKCGILVALILGLSTLSFFGIFDAIIPSEISRSIAIIGFWTLVAGVFIFLLFSFYFENRVSIKNIKKIITLDNIKTKEIDFPLSDYSIHKVENGEIFYSVNMRVKDLKLPEELNFYTIQGIDATHLVFV